MPWWLRQLVDFINWLAARISGRKYDELARRIGRDPEMATAPDRPRFVAIQIDGLAHEYLLRALALGYTPTLQRLIAHGYRLQRWRCGVPSSTPAVQAGILYGANWDIPAFRWYEKADGFAPSCKVPPHIDRIKARVVAGRPGILAGGSSYANMLDGDARLTLFTLSAMGRQRFFEQLRGLGWALLFGLIPWRTLRVIGLMIWELLRDLGRTGVLWARSRFRRRLKLVRPFLQVLTNILLGEVQAFGLLLDVYRGMPAIYANFYGYDEIAHQEGPLDREALRALRRIDNHIRQIDRVRRTCWPDMDLYILSDHGMTPTVLFEALAGQSLGRFVASHVQASVVWDEGWGQIDGERKGREAGLLPERSRWLLDELEGIEAHLSRRGQKLAQTLRRWLQDRTLPEEDPDWDLARGSDVVVRSSGNLAHIYFNVTRERMAVSEIAILYPDLLEALVRQPGIGIVLGLEADRSVVVTHHGTAALTASWLPPGLPEPEQSAADLVRLVSFPHSGDLVLLGTWDEHGQVVTFEDQVATHGGIGGPQDYPFFLTPPDVPLDLSGITNARQLYPFFMRRYHEMDVQADAR
ncbi:MAG: hypothetical protein CVU38_04315 [Chloroflexi bacterium HGW-Chloroflexi-1]|nr:MAG: hypothetical protein CVU38_04315 [Chloroflexi bacterium HGW-Chloroflexi-1]